MTALRWGLQVSQQHAYHCMQGGRTQSVFLDSQHGLVGIALLQHCYNNLQSASPQLGSTPAVWRQTCLTWGSELQRAHLCRMQFADASRGVRQSFVAVRVRICFMCFALCVGAGTSYIFVDQGCSVLGSVVILQTARCSDDVALLYDLMACNTRVAAKSGATMQVDWVELDSMALYYMPCT